MTEEAPEIVRSYKAPRNEIPLTGEGGTKPGFMSSGLGLSGRQLLATLGQLPTPLLSLCERKKKLFVAQENEGKGTKTKEQKRGDQKVSV